MSTAIKAAAHRIYDTLNEALATGDLALLDAVIAEDAIDHDPVPGMAPGLAGIKEAFRAGRAEHPDMRFVVEDIVAEGDKVACRLTLRGLAQRGIDILRIEGGKLAERWGVFAAPEPKPDVETG